MGSIFTDHLQVVFRLTSHLAAKIIAHFRRERQRNVGTEYSAKAAGERSLSLSKRRPVPVRLRTPGLDPLHATADRGHLAGRTPGRVFVVCVLMTTDHAPFDNSAFFGDFN